MDTERKSARRTENFSEGKYYVIHSKNTGSLSVVTVQENQARPVVETMEALVLHPIDRNTNVLGWTVSLGEAKG